MLTTNQKGAIAESAVAKEATKLGIVVARPLSDARYDLILDLAHTLLRVQCKWAARRGDVIVVMCRTNRRGTGGFIWRKYEFGEIDSIAADCPDTDTCYLLPLELSVDRSFVQLRLSPCRKNQRAGINWARDFEFGATIPRLHGPIAQLGERLDGIQKVAGSSPAGSMTRGPPRAG
jgi:PD-(D/E)XK endonuclease